MKKSLVVTSIAVAFVLSFGVVLEYAAAQDDAEQSNAVTLESELDKISYIIGRQLATSIIQNQLEVNVAAVLKGMDDMLNQTEPVLTEEEMQGAMMALQSIVEEKQKEAQAEREEMMAERKEEAGENIKKAQAFLEENKKKEGVVELPSGLQYQVIEKGEGDKPEATSKVKVHYRGTLLNGEQFDSSYDRGEPATFGVNQVISGWQEALQLMSPGAKLKLFIPPDLAYGENGNARIPGNSLLIFDVELLEIVE